MGDSVDDRREAPLCRAYNDANASVNTTLLHCKQDTSKLIDATTDMRHDIFYRLNWLSLGVYGGQKEEERR